MFRGAFDSLELACCSPGFRDYRPVWIGDGDFAENFTLGPLHRNCVFAPFVIVADQVQEAMYGKMGKMMSKRLLLAASLARNGLEGKDDVAQMVRGVFRWE